MAMAIVGREIGSALCKALGLPSSVTRLDIKVPADAPVEVVCRFYPSKDGMERLVELLQRYEVQPRGEARLVAACGQADPAWRILPRDMWQLQRQGDDVLAGVFVGPDNSRRWIRAPLSSLPDSFIGLDDLEKAGIFINNVDAMAG
jgi:hypothetical protein